ncbi:MAG TPA: DUF2339 domain-containing protein [Pyrinomonadaceae bacterium]|nr:DUF2339 domain-containing protein [Pyrinomonadaceae bacterium]
MDEFLIPVLLLLVIAAILSAIVLPIIALVISITSRKKLTEKISRLEQLTARIEQLEAAAQAHSIPDVGERIQPAPTRAAEQPAPQVEYVEERTTMAQQVPPVDDRETPPRATPVPSSISPIQTMHAAQLESIIGRRWLGWVAVGLILLAAAFFLKYAFDNRWIGELGRVAIGVAAGISMTWFGFTYYKRGWRVFSQILTAGGIVLLYLSVYAAFGYYHLATQKAAFVYLAILVAEAAALALLYDAPAIAIMALVGGFLSPILLRTDRDQYRSLFGYLLTLDIGALALLKHWLGLSSLAFAGTHFLFWLWYAGNYHPRKLVAVMTFQTAVFLIFLLSHIGRQLVRRKPATFEELGLLLINPFVFFATAYHLLNPDHHDWMGVFAIGMALLYAGAAKLLVDRSTTSKSATLLMIGVALTFVTIAIPIQLRQNWITIAWSVEALLMLWAAIEIRSRRLLGMAYTLFGLALLRLVFWDTPRGPRAMFTPVLNKYFLSSLVVTTCLFGAAVVYQRVDARKQLFRPAVKLVLLLVGVVTLWFVMSVETHTFFTTRAAAAKWGEDAAHERWLGQMALSVLWSVYAGTLAALGFVRRSPVVRWTALALFGLTIIKVMMVDIAQLQKLYRIIVFFVLGVLLLVVAWGYHRAFHSQESLK